MSGSAREHNIEQCDVLINIVRISIYLTTSISICCTGDAIRQETMPCGSSVAQLPNLNVYVYIICIICIEQQFGL